VDSKHGFFRVGDGNVSSAIIVDLYDLASAARVGRASSGHITIDSSWQSSLQGQVHAPFICDSKKSSALENVKHSNPCFQ
jgi:hypothetical protein